MLHTLCTDGLHTPLMSFTFKNDKTCEEIPNVQTVLITGQRYGQCSNDVRALQTLLRREPIEQSVDHANDEARRYVMPRGSKETGTSLPGEPIASWKEMLILIKMHAPQHKSLVGEKHR